jgi:hypothetical protein
MNVHQQYTSQLLHLSGYLQSSHRLFILELVLGKCLEMDVEIVIEDSGETKIQACDEHDGVEDIFQLDDDQDKFYVGSSHNKSMLDGQQRIPDAVADMADKLDALLVLVVEYVNKLLESSVKDSDDLDSMACSSVNDELFSQILRVFEDKIFMTHRSKFVQFVVFYVVGKSPRRFGEALCLRLFNTFFDGAAGAIKRQTAVIYLGSLLARCTSFDTEFVSGTVEKLILWANAYACAVNPPAARHPLGQMLHTSRSLGSNMSDYTPTKPSRTLHEPVEHNHYSSGMGSARKRNKSNDCLSSYQQQEQAIVGGGHGLISELTNDAVHRIQSSQCLNGSYNSLSSSNDILDELGRKARPLDSLTLNESFYSCVQSICYVMCFHGTEFAIKHCSSDFSRDQWINILLSPNMPLRFCLHSVRFEFFRLAEAVSLLPDELLSVLMDFTNGSGMSLSMRSTSSKGELDSSSSATLVRGGVDISYLLHRPLASPASLHGYSSFHSKKAVNPLDSFFPFDPCLLVNLNQRIEGYYRMWRGIDGVDTIAPGGLNRVTALSELHAPSRASSATSEGNNFMLPNMVEEDDELGSEGDFEGLVIDDDSDDDDDEDKSQYASSLTSHSHSRTGSNLGVSVGSDYSALTSKLQLNAAMGGIGHGWIGVGANQNQSNSAAAVISADALKQHETVLSLQTEKSRAAKANGIPLCPASAATSDASSLNSFVTYNSSLQTNGANQDQMADAGEWTLPMRRPRQYSIGSTGSW